MPPNRWWLCWAPPCAESTPAYILRYMQWRRLRAILALWGSGGPRPLPAHSPGPLARNQARYAMLTSEEKVALATGVLAVAGAVLSFLAIGLAVRLPLG